MSAPLDMPALAALAALPVYQDLRSHVLNSTALSPRFNQIRELREQWLDLVHELEHAGELDDPDDREALDYEASLLAAQIVDLFGSDQETVAPYYALPTLDLAEARAILDHRARTFYRNALEWHRADPDTREAPEHVGMKATVGAGKTHAIRHRDHLGVYIETMKAEDRPPRVAVFVKQLRLADQTEADMRRDGIRAKAFRGRSADDPDAPGEKMCRDLEAVRVAEDMGESVSRSVCGTAEGECCPWFSVCGYQRQMQAVHQADVPILAHECMTEAMPEAVKHGVGAVLADEDFLLSVIKSPRTFATAGLRDAPMRFPVLLKGTESRADIDATDWLISFWAKVARARERMPVDGFASRSALIAEGLTADDCDRASKLEWRRRRNDLLRPGMSRMHREAAQHEARGNKGIASRAELAKVIGRLLHGHEETIGTIEAVTTDNNEHAFVLRTRKPLADWVQGVPLMHTSATMRPGLVREIVDGFRLVADLRVKAPHQHVVMIHGGFGKAGMVNVAGGARADNLARDRKRTELREFIAALTAGLPSHVAVHQAVESEFADIAAVETTHLNDAHGLNSYEDVAVEVVIGPSRPKASDLRSIAIALTGKPVPRQRAKPAKRAITMSDGTGKEIDTILYDDPTMREVSEAITGASFEQAIRGRGVTRTEDNPLLLVLMGNHVLPVAVEMEMHWRDARPNVRDKMLARGAEIDSPSYAARVYPDLFVDRHGNQGSYEAARHALGLHKAGGFTAVNSIRALIGNTAANAVVEVEFRPAGVGRGNSTARLPASRALHDFQAEMEGIFGVSVVVEPADVPAAPAIARETTERPLPTWAVFPFVMGAAVDDNQVARGPPDG